MLVVELKEVLCIYESDLKSVSYFDPVFSESDLSKGKFNRCHDILPRIYLYSKTRDLRHDYVCASDSY